MGLLLRRALFYVMAAVANLNLALAVVLPVGGLAGYVKKGSKPSLIAGVGVGMAYGCASTLSKSHVKAGHGLGFATSLVLALVGYKRWVKAKKAMPAGLLTFLGILGSGANLSEFW